MTFLKKGCVNLHLDIIIYISLFIVILAAVYFFIITLIEFKRRQYINDFLGDINDKYEKRLKDREIKQLYEGVSSDLKFIDKIDDLIDRSGIRILFPILTSEMFIFITFLLAFIIAYIIFYFTSYWLYFVGTFFGVIFAIILILKLMARRTYDRIDDQILLYINTLINICSSNDDIITIIDKAIPYLGSPLRQYSEQFVFECHRGISLDKAFKNFEDKVESKRFRQLLKNLSICSKYEANYKKILNKSRIIMKHYYVEKERRRKEVAQGRQQIIITLVLGLILFRITGSFTDNLFYIMKHTTFGNVLLSYMLVVVLIAIYKFITLDKMNY